MRFNRRAGAGMQAEELTTSAEADSKPHRPLKFMSVELWQTMVEMNDVDEVHAIGGTHNLHRKFHGNGDEWTWPSSITEE